MIRRSVPFAVAFALAVVIAACSGDSMTAPNALATHERTGSSYIDRLGGTRAGGPGTAVTGSLQVSAGIDTVLVLKRSFYVASDLNATKVIGPQGGEIRIDGVGVKIVFPAGAVREPTAITMTAKRGWNVAYEFAPHGITFAVPVRIEQDLRFTLAGKVDRNETDLQAGYYTDLDGSFIDPWKLFARVSEVRRVRKAQPSNPHLVAFEVVHFSGYLMSSGFKGRGGGDDDHGSDDFAW